MSNVALASALTERLATFDVAEGSTWDRLTGLLDLLPEQLIDLVQSLDLLPDREVVRKTLDDALIVLFRRIDLPIVDGAAEDMAEAWMRGKIVDLVMAQYVRITDA